MKAHEFDTKPMKKVKVVEFKKLEPQQLPVDEEKTILDSNEIVDSVAGIPVYKDDYLHAHKEDDTDLWRAMKRWD